VLAGQVLLIVMAVAWCVQMAFMAVWGETCFAQTNARIQYGQTMAVVLVVVLAVFIPVARHGKLTEKRNRYGRQQKPWEPESLRMLNPRCPGFPDEMADGRLR
jgi:heme/copper-type cytochrome/quinol oxidase subunit 2